MEASFPERLYTAGIQDLVSIIPPGAQLTPSSKIAPASLGKSPGVKHPVNGLWHGYAWTEHTPSIEDVRGWLADGANVGVKTTRFPALDIDVLDAPLAQMIEEQALARLGAAPVRIGREPKRLLLYKLDDAAAPFSRMRLHLAQGERKFLVEFLAERQQFVAYGVHPAGQTYRWITDPTAAPLTSITQEQASAFLDYLAELLAPSYTVEREGDGRRSGRTSSVDQTSLLAPSIEALRDAVALIPNTNSAFPSRDSYIRFGYAVKAAAGAEHEEEGFECFAEWASRWDGGANDPDVVRADWRRMLGDKAIGWRWLCELARPYGFNDAVFEFDIEAPIEPETKERDDAPVLYTDQWLAAQIADMNRGRLRYVPLWKCWMVWTGNVWKRDATLAAEAHVKRGLRLIAGKLIRQGGSAAEQAAAESKARGLSSAAKVTAVLQLMRSDESLAIEADALDRDPWTLNTPAGLVDLKTGSISAPDRDALATKITSVGPAPGDCPVWRRFLFEATGGDMALERYLQRLSGYALTGVTHEQQVSFLWGPGGNGKSVFVSTLATVMGDYAQVADFSSFTATFGEKHSTDLASLLGARLVSAGEIEAGKRWDTQRIKSLTGGERIAARFMHKDNFTFAPSFKLIFTANNQPELRDVDNAMRRRMHLIPFTVTPAKVDMQLKDKLVAEYPAILAWMIEGCREWQRDGLQAPQTVIAATDEYFENEDGIQRWVDECTEPRPGGFVETRVLFESWREFANQNNEFVGKARRLGAELVKRGWTKVKDEHRHVGFLNVGLRPSELP